MEMNIDMVAVMSPQPWATLPSFGMALDPVLENAR